MTETLNRPARPMPPRPPRRAPEEERPRGTWAPGAAAALWAVVVGLLCVALPVLLVWATDDRSGVAWTEAVRSAGRFWLVAHGASLDVPGGRYALTPMGLLLVPLCILIRLSASAARDCGVRTPAQAFAFARGAAAAYATLALVVAVACSGPEVHVSPVQSLLVGAVVGGLGAAVGALRPGRLWLVPWHARSPRTRRLMRAGVVGTTLLLGAGALLVGGSLAVHASQAAELATASKPGAVGGIALLLTSLALLPNAAVWGTAWLAGPGFAVGVDTAVGPFGHELGPVPALPLLAALPSGGVPEAVAVLVLGVPLLAGAVAGRLLAGDLAADRDDEPPSWLRTVAEATAVGPVCGAALGLLAWLSAGAAGGDRLVELGPSPWAVALAVSALIGVGAVLGALVRRARLLS